MLYFNKVILGNNHKGNRLMNKNPNNRRASSGRPRTREEAILAEKRRAEEKNRRKKARDNAKFFSSVAIFSVISAAICLIVMFIYIFIDFRSADKAPGKPVKITYKEDTSVLDKSHYSYKNGEYYVSLSKLSELCSFTLHGNVKNMTLTIDDNKNASFDIGTPGVKVDGTYSVLKNKSYFENGHLFIPTGFFTDLCSGVKCEYDKVGGTHGYNIIFEEDFSFDAVSPAESGAVLYDQLEQSEGSGEKMFKADLSDFEEYMNPEDKDAYLTLINSDKKLKEDYVPDDLVEVADTRSDRDKQKMRLNAAKSLEAMFIELRANGFYDVAVISGYRSYDYQAAMLENEINYYLGIYDGDKEKAQSVASSQVTAPGALEHQSGLSADISSGAILTEEFAGEDVYKWIYSNCADFGFILRYPKDKSHITGVSFEPWHFRYVGRYHAKKIMDAGLCLEEYLSTLN